MNTSGYIVYCYQDTITAAGIVQRWRTPKNKVATGRLTQETKTSGFLIGTPTANSVIQDVLHLLGENRQFAVLVLMPRSLIPELSRLENSGGEPTASASAGDHSQRTYTILLRAYDLPTKNKLK